MNKLTDNQRRFLEKVKDERPFSMLDYTIRTILSDGEYAYSDRETLNGCIEIWQKRYRNQQ